MELPAWVYEMVIAVEWYEEVHPAVEDRGMCLRDVLLKVPGKQREIARALAAYIREVKEMQGV
jgi:hypothetical protein